MTNRRPPRLTLIILSLSLLGWFGAAQAERQIANHQEFTAILNDDQSCSEKMAIVARHPSSQAFTQRRIQLQRLLGGTQIVLNLECPQMKELLVIGESAGESVYRGVLSSKTDWALVEIIPGSTQEKRLESLPQQRSVGNEKVNVSAQKKTTDCEIKSGDDLNALTECVIAAVEREFEYEFTAKIAKKHRRTQEILGALSVTAELSECDREVASYAGSNMILGKDCESLPGFDTLYKVAWTIGKIRLKALEGTWDEPTTANPSLALYRSGLSGQQLRQVGLWFLKKANHPLEYEKAYWYLVNGSYLINEKLETHEKIKFPEEIYVSQAAVIAANEYANPKSDVYDPDRATMLHLGSGLQTSLLAAGYIERLRIRTDEDRKPYGGQPVFIKDEARYFRWATNCSQENLTREKFPYTQELCDVAQRELADANRRINQAYDSYMKPQGENVLGMFFVGLVGLAILGSQSGGYSDTELERGQQAYQAEQKRIQRQINEDLAIGWATAGTKW